MSCFAVLKDCMMLIAGLENVMMFNVVLKYNIMFNVFLTYAMRFSVIFKDIKIVRVFEGFVSLKCTACSLNGC